MLVIRAEDELTCELGGDLSSDPACLGGDLGCDQAKSTVGKHGIFDWINFQGTGQKACFDLSHAELQVGQNVRMTFTHVQGM